MCNRAGLAALCTTAGTPNLERFKYYPEGCEVLQSAAAGRQRHGASRLLEAASKLETAAHLGSLSITGHTARAQAKGLAKGGLLDASAEHHD